MNISALDGFPQLRCSNMGHTLPHLGQALLPQVSIEVAMTCEMLCVLSCSAAAHPADWWHSAILTYVIHQRGSGTPQTKPQMDSRMVDCAVQPEPPHGCAECPVQGKLWIAPQLLGFDTRRMQAGNPGRFLLPFLSPALWRLSLSPNVTQAPFMQFPAHLLAPAPFRAVTVS